MTVSSERSDGTEAAQSASRPNGEDGIPADYAHLLQVWTDLLRRSAGAASAAGVLDAATAQRAWDELVYACWFMNPFTRILPLDPVEIGRSFEQLWTTWLRDPVAASTGVGELMGQQAQLWAEAARRLMGNPDAAPVVKPEHDDRRFSSPDWHGNVYYDTIKQSYLIAASSLLKAAAEAHGLDRRQQRAVMFHLRQYLDAISPSNFAFTNPDVLHEAVRTGGQSLVRGTQNLLRDLQTGRIKMTDTEAFAPGRNLALTPGQVVFRNPLIELIQYAPATSQVAEIPLLIIPPWINKFYILDLQAQNSLIRFLVEQGLTVFVVSWKNPDASLEDTSFEDYLDLGPRAAMDVVKEITGSSKVNLVGYCIGGTLLAMLLAYLAATRERSVRSATFLVSLVDFSEVGDTAVFIDDKKLAYIEQEMMERGYLDSHHMATMFNMLRANDLIWSSVVNNYLLGKDAPAFDLLYWNADGTRMTRAAHSFYLRNTYVENNLVKPGRLQIKGVPIDLRRIRLDVYALGTAQDHIVPWRSAWEMTRLTRGAVRFVLGASGHIAGVISPPSKPRGFWTNDRTAESPQQWLETADQATGSWWTDWVAWLRPRSGKPVEPPPVGSAAYPPLAPAPGTYVLEK